MTTASRPSSPPISTATTGRRSPRSWRPRGARTFAGRDDADGIPVPTDVPVDDGGRIRVGHVELTARHLVGPHAGLDRPGLRRPARPPPRLHRRLPVPGRRRQHAGPGASTRLIGDVETKLFDVLPDETWVYPGHGNDTTLGAERPHLAEWRARGW